MTQSGEIPDIEDGLPTLEDYQATVGTAGKRRGPGRPRKNPFATQETLKRFEVEYRREQRARLKDARRDRKLEVDDYVEQVFDAHPQIQALLIGLVNHVFEFAQRGEGPMTDYDARTYVTQVVSRHLKHMISPKATIEFLKAHHEMVGDGGPVGDFAESATIDDGNDEAAESEDEDDEELTALIMEGLPGGEYAE